MSKLMTARTIEEAVKKARGTKMFNESQTARENLFNQITYESSAGGTLPLSKYSFLRYQGILPLNLPDGLRIVVLPDIHAPAHNKQWLWMIEQFLAEYRPHILIFIGDSTDFFFLSRWPKPPRQGYNAMQELEESRELHDRLIKVSGCLWAFETEGNHENRTNSFLSAVAPQISTLVDMDSQEPVMNYSKLLGYKGGERITFVTDERGFGGYGGCIILNGQKRLIHGLPLRPRAGGSPRVFTDQLGQDVMHGHSHRFGENHRETLEETLAAQEIGYLANPNRAEMSYHNLLSNGHPGLAAGEVIGGTVNLELIPIIQAIHENRLRYSMWYGDREYVTED